MQQASGDEAMIMMIISLGSPAYLIGGCYAATKTEVVSPALEV